jgi:putative hydrolase of the HAD superfamily
MQRNMKKKAILFDFGNTLTHYFKSRIPISILEQNIDEVKNYLNSLNLLNVSREVIWQNVKKEAVEAKDHRVRPMADRLCRIFKIQVSDLPAVGDIEMCRRFMSPIFKMGKCYNDTVPTLCLLKEKGIKTAIVSNAPWGCPAQLCREEVVRVNLVHLMDDIIFCTDIGWRKPAKQIFEYALNRLQETPEHCLFVGDHPEWDFEGPRSIGIDAVLVDRSGTPRIPDEYILNSLGDIQKWIR